MINAYIAGVAGYLPPDVLTNADLARMVDTSDDWIRERTGIQTRHILGQGLGTSVMGIEAVNRLLAKTGCLPQEIDLLICATVTPDMQFPATANLIAYGVGAGNAWSFDVEAACSSFLYALTVGAQFIQTGRYTNVVVVGADKMSSIIDYTDRNTCVLFGDGAGAVLLRPAPATAPEVGIREFVHYSDGAGAVHLHQKAGGSRLPASAQTVEQRLHYVYQEGKAVFKRAIEGMIQATQAVLERSGLTAADIDWLVPHQANLRIIDNTAQHFGLSAEKVMLNISKYGNTTSATLPLCLMDYESQLKPGDKLILVAFGGGFTWGGLYLVWGY
jgi:3-oxoacyl-[acyl-carrier-protein] synthase-3